MSTKSSIAYGPDFHLYHEMMEDGAVYLQIEGQAFEASPGEVTVRIPIAVWEHIRQFKGFHPEHHTLSDTQILDKVTAEVDHRIQRYQEADDRGRGWINLEGWLVYGEATAPRDQQIQDGVEYITRRREAELLVLAQIEALKTP